VVEGSVVSAGHDILVRDIALVRVAARNLPPPRLTSGKKSHSSSRGCGPSRPSGKATPGRGTDARSARTSECNLPEGKQRYILFFDPTTVRNVVQRRPPSFLPLPLSLFFGRRRRVERSGEVPSLLRGRTSSKKGSSSSFPLLFFSIKEKEEGRGGKVCPLFFFLRRNCGTSIHKKVERAGRCQADDLLYSVEKGRTAGAAP